MEDAFEFHEERASVSNLGQLHWFKYLGRIPKAHGGWEEQWMGLVNLSTSFILGTRSGGSVYPKHVFSGGGGWIYVVFNDGEAIRFHHGDVIGGTAGTSPTETITSGWTGYTQMFSPGRGIIFGVKPNGDLDWTGSEWSMA